MPAKKFQSFAIFGAMRSGSNLLERFINQYAGLKCHGELFNPAFIGWSGRDAYLGVNKAARDKEPRVLMDAILAKDNQNIPGFRIFRDHSQNAIDFFLNDPDCAKVILMRDPVNSFVSLKIARKTDQWLIEHETHRKTAQIYFDLQEFERYKKIRRQYSQMILARLKSTGQRFFGIHYDQLTDIKKINEIAKFIGAKRHRTSLEQPIKRQNPGPLCDKIVNYSEVWQALGLPEPDKKAGAKPGFAPEKGTDLSRAYFCKTRDIIFAPIPSAPDGSVRDWLAEIDGAAPQNDFSSAAFDDWQKNHGKPLIFSVLRHPVARAYDVFMRKIFLLKPTGFKAIREALESKFGVFLPSENQDYEKSGYDTTAHRAAFKQFLAFVHHNLSGKSDIRTDGRWRSQSDLIAGYEKQFGSCICINEADLLFGTGYIANRLALMTDMAGIKTDAPNWDFTLQDIYDTEIETLTRTAYASDYQKFSFENWS